ncbi:cytochrome P450 1A1-like isoform X2 [Mercenaria mercenaria]|uniref:cytochrome P450 1A1-like isoform X2 n=1 Tax=Mercenaria mercenaria TaxID=6596 RepID=UPI00234F0D63|nr:cytochrome P450 1A1-like isoform X2 [Mercenaria mercenaria]
MRSCLRIARTLCKPISSSFSGFKKDVYSVTCVVSNSNVSEIYQKPKTCSERIRNGNAALALPFKVAKSGRLHLYFHKLSQDYGSITKFKLLRKNIFVLNTFESVEKLLELNGHANGRSSPFFQYYVFQNKGFSFGDFTDVGERQKEILKNCLHYEIVHSRNVILKEIDGFIFGLLNENKNLNIDYIRLFLSNVFSRQLIGETLPVDDPDSKLLWELIDHLYTLLEPSIDAPLRVLPFLRFLPGKYRNIFRDTIKARDGVARRYFDTQKSTYKEGRVRGLVDVCLKIQQEEMQTKGESWLTDDYIKGLMYDTVAAGMSEMMKSIRMLILLMCHYQNVQSRVHTEIDDVIGTTSIPCSSHRNKMPYTEAVLLEMLRYVSQTPLAIPHKSNKDVVLDGYLIEKDSGIFPNIWGIHHDEIVWGDPWVFRPERFLTENDQLLPADHKLRRTLIPFSVGKRRCPGEDFAMSRLFLLFTSMLQRIEFSPPAEEELPSADPRLYTNKYPLLLPVFTCRALPREAI